MMVIRSYVCNDCQTQFEVTCESGSDGDPDCPSCSKVLQWVPGMFAISGVKSKALDLTQKIMEQEYGYSNFKDNTREGETVVMAPTPPTTSSNDALMQQVSEFAQSTAQPLNPVQKEMAASFWGSGNQVPQIPVAQVLASAKANAALATQEGVNPMALLHRAGREGKLPLKINVIARAKM